MAADNTTLYLAVGSQSGEALAAIPKSGGSALADIATTQFVAGIAVDGASIYVAEDTSSDPLATGRILKFAKAGGTPTVLADNQGALRSVAVDGTYVYWNCPTEGTIKRIGK